MIDRTMLTRLLAQIGTPEATVTEKGMELARAIFAAGVAEEREACARVCDRQAQLQMDTGADDCCITEAKWCARYIRRRSNAGGEATGADLCDWSPRP